MISKNVIKIVKIGVSEKYNILTMKTGNKHLNTAITTTQNGEIT
jgi:hypothetical protein